MGPGITLSLHSMGIKKKIYVDNILESTVNAPGSISSNTFDIFIGENSQARGRYFHGSIDDVRIYKKVLSVEEIGSLYLNESQSDKWIAHYRVQEGDNGSVNFEINYQDTAVIQETSLYQQRIGVKYL